MQNRCQFSLQNTPEYDPAAGTCTRLPIVPSSGTTPAWDSYLQDVLCCQVVHTAPVQKSIILGHIMKHKFCKPTSQKHTGFEW